MEIGKVPESVLKRSIFKQIHTKRPEVLVGAGVGEDLSLIHIWNWRNFMIEKVTARSAIHGWHGMRSCENLFLKKTGQIRSTISV